MEKMMDRIRLWILAWLGLADVPSKLEELDTYQVSQRHAITTLDNAIARISRDGLPPNVMTTDNVLLKEMMLRIQALEAGRVSPLAGK